ncbi:hypothetical protein Gorai_017557 [Gossypium raimondii]|uniref:Uncharacterized protein n=1 Tax=Gossypium raimondii TaxID=29730 RepID=A0A7J8PCA0_GOSRA|nr:hypothetical protein [Gossypium raimondii]
MADVDRGESPSRLEGKFCAAVACWILGFGSLICWNSMLTMGDYYYHLFPVASKTVNNIRMLSWDDGLSAPRSELDT